MAASVTANVRHNTRYTIGAAQHGGMTLEIGTFTPSTTYTTGGDALTFPSGVPSVVYAQAQGGYISIWDATNEKMMYYRSTGGALAETTAGVDLGTATMLNTPYIAFGFRDK